MGAVTIQQMSERVAELMEERLRVKGRDLGEKLHKGGRILPGKVRKAAEALALAAEQSHNPKLLLQLDEGVIAENYDICLKHLTTLSRADKRRGVMLGLTTSIFFSLLVVAGLVLTVLVWRGFL